jgi:hypothetical protein
VKNDLFWGGVSFGLDGTVAVGEGICGGLEFWRYLFGGFWMIGMVGTTDRGKRGD